MKTRIIVCGGRNFDDKKEFYRNLDIILREYSDVEIISGNAKGADRFAEEYADEKNIPVAVFKPDWEKYGKAAGPQRNKAMLEYAAEEKPVVIAFWDGKSPGTGDMISRAESAGAVCHIIRYEENFEKEIEEIVKTVLSGI